MLAPAVLLHFKIFRLILDDFGISALPFAGDIVKSWLDSIEESGIRGRAANGIQTKGEVPREKV